MAQQKKNNKLVNVFDLIALLVVIFVVSLFVFSLCYPPKITGKPMTVTIKVTSDDKAIYETAIDQKQVFLNSSNQSLSVKNTSYLDGSLQITLIGSGEIKDSNTIFNGQRILVGQKAEIHGNYFAQGIITSIVYEN